MGPYPRCPYCGADVGQRLAVRTLKYGSLLLAVAGLALLFLVAARSEVPVVRVGDLAGTMNWAYVRVEGVVSRQPAYDPADADLTLWIWDGTGEIMAVAYRAEAEKLLAMEPLPVMGDGVSLAGTLRFTEDFVYLVLNDPEQMEIRPAEALAMQVAEVHPGLRYQKVRLRGVIRDERIPYEGLQIASLWDDSGEIDLVLSTAAPVPAVGQAVEVVGAVDLYRDDVQVSVGRAADLVILDEALPIASLRAVGSLSTADVGALVAVEGSLAEIAPFSAGVRGRLSDGSGTVTLLLWQDYYEALPPAAVPGPGDMIHVQGQVAEYRGELEIVPELPGDLLVLSRFEAASTGEPRAIAQSPPASPTPVAEPTQAPGAQPTDWPATEPAGTPVPSSTPTPAPSPTPMPLPTARPSPTPPPTPAAETRAIASITAEDVDKTLTVELAGIAAVDYLSKGVKYTLTDASGSIALLVWQDVLEEVTDRHDLLPGSQVRVTGRIDEYEGELEIVPRGGEGVTVVNRGSRPPVEERSMAAIAAPDEGRVLTVQGALDRIEGRGWLRLWLQDGTGEILIFVPERVVPYLPPGLGPGTRLRVTGEVEIYQGSLEIIPLAGADVEVR